jgi:hypothetical protein
MWDTNKSNDAYQYGRLETQKEKLNAIWKCIKKRN